jgi:hypothetical protein
MDFRFEMESDEDIDKEVEALSDEIDPGIRIGWDLDKLLDLLIGGEIKSDNYDKYKELDTFFNLISNNEDEISGDFDDNLNIIVKLLKDVKDKELQRIIKLKAKCGVQMGYNNKYIKELCITN